ncbi:MAG: alanine--tRNA ligase [Bacteroidota bacterium]|jgi:alanyl-tRNA synthetase
MTSTEIRHSFLSFFAERGHAIVPSSPVVPYDDPTLLFANAGMNQFKDVFLGKGKRSYSRAADTQKCIRVSGKHNDLEEVGRDTYHHTFFEMLGNWSFGDYYKKEAIHWAWDLLTRVWGLPKNRLWATVYKDDEEAEGYWKTVTDIDHSHILRFGEKDNFWEMGETGPCGPCSEIHIDRTPQGNADASLVNAGVPEVMEIWNLVFIQYNRDAKGVLNPLPAKHVDTGMGFERICAVLQNKTSNYDTDVFMPLITRIGEITHQRYDGRLTGIDQKQFDVDTAMRVLADHIRALTFAIADSATPSNEGRGYVLRRLLRRAARFGRNLGMHEPFLYQLVPTLADTMSDIFPELGSKQSHIQKIIRGEEEGFNATLDRGLEIFEQVVQQIGHSKTFPGEDAFKLYDTFGFPLDLTELLAGERGLKVDVGSFTELMEEQRKRSRAVEVQTQPETVGASVQASSALDAELTRARNLARALDTSSFEGKFKFLGYDQVQAQSTVLSSNKNLLVLESTPFYGEAGGQIGDRGEVTVDGMKVRVLDTQKSGNVNVHILDSPLTLSVGHSVEARIDTERRNAIMRNHSATHLVHAALRKILGTHVHQAGSLVGPEYLRFDFAHFSKVSDQELADVEALVNEKIRENIKLTHHRNIPFEEAKKMGALMFFGDKYGDRVNVVEFGDFSREFCGGTHVHTTEDIGYFKFRSEGSVASGVRRIEAVTATHALELMKFQDRSASERLEYATSQLQEIRDLAVQSGESQADFEKAITTLEATLNSLKKNPAMPQSFSEDLLPHFNERARREISVETLILEIAEKRKSIEKELSKSRLQSQSGAIDGLVAGAQQVNGIRVVSAQVKSGSLDELKTLGDTLRSKLGHGVGLLAAVIDNKVSLVCVVTDDLVAAKKLEAGKIVGSVARLLGGGGGGKAHLATAGGKDVSKLPEALSSTGSIIHAMLVQS